MSDGTLKGFPIVVNPAQDHAPSIKLGSLDEYTARFIVPVETYLNALLDENSRLAQENNNLRAALTDLCSLAETFTLVAAYQGTPLTALSKSVEATWRVLYG